MNDTEVTRDGRVVLARLIGVGVALGVMAVLFRTIGWPAPGIAAAIGFGAYLLARGPRR